MAKNLDGAGDAGDATPARTVPLRLVPREHGASFMSVHALLLGIVAGFAGGGRSLWGLLLALAFGALFLPLTAAISVLSHPKLAARAKRRSLALLALGATVAALALLHGPARQLLLLAGGGAVLAGVYAAARARTGTRSPLTELAAVAGICLLAPLAWLLVAGQTARWPLSAPVAFLAFGGTVPYVRARVRRRRGPSPTARERLNGGLAALLWQAVVLLTAAATAAAGAVHLLVPVSFVPGAAKTFVGILKPESRPPIRRIGYLETAISTVFAALAGVGLGIAPP